jgi:hypothetical protein
LEIKELEEKKKEEFNLNDFKELIENNKLQSQVNFFDTSDDNYNIIKRDNKHVVNANIELENLTNNLKNKKDYPTPIPVNKPDPKDRMPRDITKNNINKMNNIYEKYSNVLKKQSNTNYVPNNHLEDDSGDFMQSINNFNNNLRPFSAINNDIKDDSYAEVNKNKGYNNKNISNKNNSNSYINTQNNNPINDLDNEDSVIKDLTKVTKFALNEINQSE